MTDKELVERLRSHMGKQDVGILLADCRKAADRLTTLSAEREALVVEKGWQPIETAPADRSIWVASADKGYGTGGMEPARTRSRCDWVNIYTNRVIDWPATHWQPLPEPPAIRSLSIPGGEG